MSNDRRLNMYFSENKHIDEAIYQYFESISNKQDVIKMVLYNYIKSKNTDDVTEKIDPIQKELEELREYKGNMNKFLEQLQNDIGGVADGRS